VLIIVMMIATLLLVALTVALPSVYQEDRREREAELVFRGTQYARAIALFHRQLNRYPVSVQELLETNGMRFLRQEYRDPMDPKGKWRYIHANAAGVLIDSKNQPLSPNLPNANNPAGLNASAAQAGQPGQTDQTNSQTASAFFGSGNEVRGAYIVGVAPTSHHESIRIWRKYTHYDEWEFVGIDLGALGMQVGMPSFSSGGGQPPIPQTPDTSPGSANPTGSPVSTQPATNPSTPE
jgi:type II secretory pathway pseudopilin PulG